MKIKLLAPHTHNGRRHPLGAIIDVPDSSAKFLIKRNRAETAPADKAPARPAPATDADPKKKK